MPGDLATFVRLGVDRLARPEARREEHANPGKTIRVCVVTQVREGQVSRIDGDADFLQGLAGCGLGQGLAARSYASTTLSCSSPMATTPPRPPTPADGPTPAASSRPSPASSETPQAATGPASRTPKVPARIQYGLSEINGGSGRHSASPEAPHGPGRIFGVIDVPGAAADVDGITISCSPGPDLIYDVFIILSRHALSYAESHQQRRARAPRD